MLVGIHESLRIFDCGKPAGLRNFAPALLLNNAIIRSGYAYEY
jgi:hypothetical protein